MINVNKYISLSFNEPKKLIAILVVIVMAGLSINEILKVFRPNIDARKNLHQNTNSNNRETINAHSPLFSMPLFGDYVALSNGEIKQSTLDLVIEGIMYSPKEGSSQVLIKAADGAEHTYLIGDKLAGGAVIKRITKNGIVVLYNKTLESLSLLKNELIFDEPAKPLGFGDGLEKE